MRKHSLNKFILICTCLSVYFSFGFVDAAAKDAGIPSAKKILEDLSDSKTIEEFKDIFADKDKGSSNERLHLARFIDVADYCNFLISRIEYLSRNNSMLYDFIINNSSDAALVKSAKKVHLQSKKLAEGTSTEASAGRNANIPDSISFNDATSILFKKRDKFLEKLDQIQMLNRKLRSLKRETIASISAKKEHQALAATSPKVEVIEVQLPEKDRASISQEDAISKFGEQMQTVQLKFETVQERLKQTDKKIVELTRDLAGMSLEAYEKNKVIADRDTFIEELKGVVTDTRQRLNLVQRIIQEKDNHIQELEEEILGLRTIVSDESGSRGVDAFKTGMNDFNARFQAQFETSRNRIALLEEKIDVINEKYTKLESLIKIKNNEISQLRETVIVKDGEIEKSKELFALKDNKLIELRGVLQIYKGKLTDATSNLKNKEEELNHLQNIIDDMERQLERHVDAVPSDGEELGSGEKIYWSGPIETLTHKKILEETMGEIDRLKNEKNIF